jgi:hypothetical protein
MSYKFKESVPPFDDCEDDPVGILEVASRLGVQDRSVHMMRRRDRLPEPDYDSINGSRAWHWRTILWWAGETGRLYSTSLENEYRVTFGLEPPIVVNGRHLSGLVMRPDPHAEQPKVPANPKKAAG